MKTFYIYEVIGHKNGATIEWDKRSRENFEKYGIMPILIETMEGPNEPEFWQIVGDREWELAEQNGYPKGEHYRSAREKRPIFENGIKCIKCGAINNTGNHTQHHGDNCKIEIARLVRNLRNDNLTYRKIAEITSLDLMTVQRIITNKIYTEV